MARYINLLAKLRHQQEEPPSFQQSLLSLLPKKRIWFVSQPFRRPVSSSPRRSHSHVYESRKLRKPVIPQEIKGVEQRIVRLLSLLPYAFSSLVDSRTVLSPCLDGWIELNARASTLLPRSPLRAPSPPCLMRLLHRLTRPPAMVPAYWSRRTQASPSMQRTCAEAWRLRNTLETSPSSTAYVSETHDLSVNRMKFGEGLFAAVM